jgi:hypothetical protein
MEGREPRLAAVQKPAQQQPEIVQPEDRADQHFKQRFADLTSGLPR